MSIKTKATSASVETFLETTSNTRRAEANVIIAMMHEISAETPVMWGSSIIGFGSVHYKYETGHEGDMPVLAFSPRTASLTIYFEGFDSYGELLSQLGKHTHSVSCLYIRKLADVDLNVLRSMLEQSYTRSTQPADKTLTVDTYLKNIPSVARPKFDELRSIVKDSLPDANEVVSYGIIGYKVDTKRARIFISGWKDHVAIYPVPANEQLRAKLAPYIKGKGTLWFNLNDPLPKSLIQVVVKSLTS